MKSLILCLIYSTLIFAQSEESDTKYTVADLDKMFAVELDNNNSYNQYGENKQASGCEKQAENLNCKFNKTFKVADKSLNADAKIELDKVIGQIKDFIKTENILEFAVQVHGNASYISFSEEGGNDKLALDRAKIVQDYLTQNFTGLKYQFATPTSKVSGPAYDTNKAGKYTQIEMEKFYEHQYVSMFVKVLKKVPVKPTQPAGSFACGQTINVSGVGSSKYCGLVDNGKGYTAAIYVKGAKKISLKVDAFQVPDRFSLEYDNKVIQDTDYISSYYQPGKTLSLIDANVVEEIRKTRKAELVTYINKLNSLSKPENVTKNDFISNFYGVEDGACPKVYKGFVTYDNFSDFRDCIKQGVKYYIPKINISTDDDFEAVMPSYISRTDKSTYSSETNPHNDLIKELKERIDYPACATKKCSTSWDAAVKKANSHVHAQQLAVELLKNGIKQYVLDFFEKGFYDIDPKEAKSIQNYTRFKQMIDKYGCGEIKNSSPQTLVLDGSVIENGKDELAYLKVYAPLVNLTVWSAKVICE